MLLALSTYSPALYKISAVLFLLFVLAVGATAQVVQESDANLDRIDVIEHLGEKLPLDIALTNDQGEAIKLADFFASGKPVLLTLGYYECPMLCNLVFNGLSQGVEELEWLPGDEFQMVTVSIDPGETSELAFAKKRNYIDNLSKEISDDGWVFCVGTQEETARLAEAIGFSFFYDEEKDEFAHPAVAFLLAADGTITRYLYGIDFKRQDLKLALLEASEGTIGNTIDRIILYCFHYDPQAGGYVVFAANVMRLGGSVVLLILALFLGRLFLAERRKRRQLASQGIPVRHG